MRRNNTTLSGTGTVRPADRAHVARRPFGTRRARGFDSRHCRCAMSTTTAAVTGRDTNRAFPRPRRPSPSRPLSITNPFLFPRTPRDGCSRFSFLRRTDARPALLPPPVANEPAALPTGFFAKNPALETVMYFGLWYFLNVQ